MNINRLQKLTEHKAHDILGVPSDATPEQIKAAFRKLARQHHPDIGGDPEKFKQVADAHEYLTGGGTERERRRQAAEYGDGVSSPVTNSSGSRVRTPSKTRIPTPTPATTDDQKQRLQKIHAEDDTGLDERQNVVRRFVHIIGNSAKTHGHDHMEKSKSESIGDYHPQGDVYREMLHAINTPVKPNRSANHLGVIITDMRDHIFGHNNNRLAENTPHLVGDRHLYGAYRTIMEHPGLNASHLKDITRTMIGHGGGSNVLGIRTNVTGWKNVAKILRKRDTQEGQKPNDSAWMHYRKFMEDLVHHPADTNSDVSRMIVDHHDKDPDGIDPHIVDIARKKIESQQKETKNESVIDKVSKILNENFYI